MAFRKIPIIEEAPRCIVCKVTVYDGSYVCSVTCEDIWDIGEFFREPMTELEDACYD